MTARRQTMPPSPYEDGYDYAACNECDQEWAWDAEPEALDKLIAIHNQSLHGEEPGPQQH
jgi:hypothetical protein